MATVPDASAPRSSRLSLNSYQTALCLVPPANACTAIDQLRAQHDKNFDKWPPHINIVYPFVAPDALPEATELIRTRLAARQCPGTLANERLRLNKPDFFAHPNSSTVFVTIEDPDGQRFLQELRDTIVEPFQGGKDDFKPHLSVGQSQGSDVAPRDYLLSKAALLPVTAWVPEELVVLIREHAIEGPGHSSSMRVWGTIDVAGTAVMPMRQPDIILDQSAADGLDSSDIPDPNSACLGLRRVTYHFDEERTLWVPREGHSSDMHDDESESRTFSVSSYNVLIGAVYPPEPERYPVLLRNILSNSAVADVLVLQEVSDPFLSYLLGDCKMRRHYPFTTHAPSDQADIGPLDSMRNIVILSRRGFTWSWLPFHSRHKAALVLSFDRIGKTDEATFLPLVLAAVHLTCGLSDGALAAKQSQLRTLLSHLRQRYPHNPWLVAGDFNLTTSTYTVDAAAKAGSVSNRMLAVLPKIDSMLFDAGLSDAWHAARAGGGTNFSELVPASELGPSYDGEEGATFDPLNNLLAAETVSDGLGNRPQRYDRILFRAAGLLVATELSQFGSRANPADDPDTTAVPYGSDHWGIRALFRLQAETDSKGVGIANAQALLSLKRRSTESSISSVAELKSLLASHAMFPSADESKRRQEAFELLKGIVQIRPRQQHATDGDGRSNVIVNVTPVGSYAFDTWTADSDIDCLCVGNISARTFFALVQPKLRKAAAQGCRIVRRVAAATGKMLELDVWGVRVELHYCAAARLAESWPNALSLPAHDPAFDLPLQSLTKLQPLRDFEHLQRTIPNLAAYRLAYRMIKLWAQSRGVYAARFGYLGGVHITLLLTRICKLLHHEAGVATSADLVRTFFGHYATFDWTNEIVYDTFFYRKPPFFYRTGREPMAILTLHRPVVNVARAASMPSAKTLVTELQRADRILDSETSSVTSWSALVGDDQRPPSVEFRASYTSFVKIDVQYWGSSTTQRLTLLGWLESRCTLLLTNLGRKVPELHARIWPARFRPRLVAATASPTLESGSNETQDYQGCYLVGLDKSTEQLSPDKLETVESALYVVMQDFATQLRGDEKYFDAHTTWIDVSLAKRPQIMELELDEHSNGALAFAEGEDDESDDEELDDSAGRETAPLSLELDAAPAEAHSAPSKAARTGHCLSSQQSRPKLRPAADILSRLRWDPALDAADYLIGWEDRFVGVCETPLTAWKAETTDEEFVPLHRIIFFRRKSDGVKVWDRESRSDLLFGSGVSAPESR